MKTGLVKKEQKKIIIFNGNLKLSKKWKLWEGLLLFDDIPSKYPIPI